jgi:LuxR family transcriptional regulator, quorum-sensing system regulator CciR
MLLADKGQRQEGPVQVLQDFVESAGRVTSMTDLRALLQEVCEELSFDFFAIVHHLRFGRPTLGNVRLTNYPPAWIASFRQRDRIADPVLRAAERSPSGFRWDRLEALIDLSSEERSILRQAERHGIGEGFTVPNHVPGEAFGSCHFAVRRGRPFPDRNIYAAQAVGAFAFEAARRLIEERPESSERYLAPAPLTDRQRECLVFAARGKSDSVIAQLLNIRPRTVNEHIEAAKRRYCVATRSQLMIRALFRSEILYSEVID